MSSKFSDWLGAVSGALGFVVTVALFMANLQDWSNDPSMLHNVSIAAFLFFVLGTLWFFIKSSFKAQWRWTSLVILYIFSAFYFTWAGTWLFEKASESVTQSADIYGTYEWQWAGENWYGRISFDEVDNRKAITQARVGVIDKAATTDLIWMNGRVLELVSGTYEITQGNVEIDLIVNKYDKRLQKVVQQTITGLLQPTRCYAGQVTYENNDTGDKYGGDMILVDYKSHLSNIVDDWFQQDAPPWSEK